MNLESLLQPISEENPTGVDLRSDMSPTSTYNVLKDARNNARAAERNNVFDASDTTALSYWKKIDDLAPKATQQQTKDLEICSWYIEASVRIRGFEGLLLGFRVLRGLIEQYWDKLYPMPDEDGIETRIFSITGLNGEGAEGVLIAPIRNVPITHNSSGADFTYWQYKQAVDIQKISDDRAKQERISAAGFSFADIQRAVNDTSDVDYLELKSFINECINEYRAISTQLDTLCGKDSPPTRNIITVLEDCMAAVNHLYQGRAIVEPTDATEMNTETGAATGNVAAGVMTGGSIKSRDQAFQLILEVSAYFRRTEPHSPVSYVLEKAVKWGRMPLDQLIPELIADGHALEQYRNLTGIVNSDKS